MWVHHTTVVISTTTHMRRLFKIKKKSPNPPPQPTCPGNPVDTLVEPLGFRAELSAGPQGRYSCYRGLLVACPDPDLVVTPDERSGMSPRVTCLVREGEDQQNPSPEASTPGVAVGDGTRCRDRSTGERS